jgi:hypothetical protein
VAGEIVKPKLPERICPECGSANTDCPRTYSMREFSPRFVHAQPQCLDCGHRGPTFHDIGEAFAAWERK